MGKCDWGEFANKTIDMIADQGHRAFTSADYRDLTGVIFLFGRLQSARELAVKAALGNTDMPAAGRPGVLRAPARRHPVRHRGVRPYHARVCHLQRLLRRARPAVAVRRMRRVQPAGLSGVLGPTEHWVPRHARPRARANGRRGRRPRPSHGHRKPAARCRRWWAGWRCARAPDWRDRLRRRRAGPGAAGALHAPFLTGRADTFVVGGH